MTERLNGFESVKCNLPNGDRFVESMRYVRADPTELPILADLLPQIETLVEIIGRLWDWGTEQPQVSP